MTTVRNVNPPKNMVKIMNRVFKAVLRSPLRGMMGGDIMVLSFTGRKSGKRYSTPVSCLREGDNIYFFTIANWWKNFIGGAGVDILHEGQRLSGTAHPITEPEEVARMAHHFLQKLGVENAFKVGLEIEHAPGEDPATVPTPEEIQAGMSGRVMVKVALQAR